MSHHHHGPDCTCGCHHHGDAARALAEEALVLSRSWSCPDAAADPAALEAEVRSGLRALADLLAEDGIILGHLKALLRCGDGGLALSITRLEAVDAAPVPLWPPSAPATGWSVTVNVLSLIHQDKVDESVLDALFPSL